MFSRIHYHIYVNEHQVYHIYMKKTMTKTLRSLTYH